MEVMSNFDIGKPMSLDSRLHTLLKHLHFKHVWTNRSTFSGNRLAKAIGCKLENRYKLYFQEAISDNVHGNCKSNKLRTYCLFKKHFKLENYVQINVEKSVIATFAKFSDSYEAGAIALAPGRARKIKSRAHLITLVKKLNRARKVPQAE